MSSKTYVVLDARGCACAHSRSRTLAERAARRAKNVGSHVEELNRAAGDDAKLREIHGYVEKYLAILGRSSIGILESRPRIVLRSNIGASWLGRTLWTMKDPGTSTIEVQRTVLADATTLERVVAHEMVHHVDSILNGEEQVRLKRLGLYDGHGRTWRDLAAIVNAEMGPCFVTVESNKEYVVDSVCKSYLVMIVPLGNGRFGYAWAARLSPKGAAYMQKKIDHDGARAVYSTDVRWTQGAKIKEFGGVSAPRDQADQAKLREMYDSVEKIVAARTG